MTTINAQTDDLAQQKYEEHKQYAESDGAVTLIGGSGIDLTLYPCDQDLSKNPIAEKLITSYTWKHLEAKSGRQACWQNFCSIGGNGPLFVGAPSTVADNLDFLLDEADIDGFNCA